MFYVDVAGGDALPYCIFSVLHMSEALSCHVTGPLYTGSIVVVENCSGKGEKRQKEHIFEKEADVKDVFGAFIRGVNFGLGSASSGDGLSL